MIQLGSLRGLTSLCSRHWHWLASVYGPRESLQVMRGVFLWIQKEAVWLESNFTPTTSCNLGCIYHAWHELGAQETGATGLIFPSHKSPAHWRIECASIQILCLSSLPP